MTDENEEWKAKAREVWHEKKWAEPKVLKLILRP
jgi:hypothetical protein